MHVSSDLKVLYKSVIIIIIIIITSMLLRGAHTRLLQL